MNKTALTLIGLLFLCPAFGGEIPQNAELAGEIDVSNWCYRKKIAISTPGVQQVELDLAVLGKSNDGGTDIRLVQGNQQVPYVFATTFTFREMTPDVKSLESKKNSQLSVWHLTMPQKNLYVAEIVFETQDFLFKRSVKFYEQFVDDQGSKKRRKLYEEEWIRSSSDQPKEFRVRLPREVRQWNTRLRESEILVVVENGDNQPLSLSGFKVAYFAPQLLFKNSSIGDVWLYYGNKRAKQPQYEITEITDEIQNAEKIQNSLGEEEILQAARWWAFTLESKLARIAFWVVLSLISLILLYVISKLLPEQKQP